MCSRNYTLFDLVWLEDVPPGCIDIHNLVLLFMVMCHTATLALQWKSTNLFWNYLRLYFKLRWDDYQIQTAFHIETTTSWLALSILVCRFSELNASWNVFERNFLVKFDQTTVSELSSKMFSDTSNWETYFQNTCNFQSLFYDPHSNLQEFHIIVQRSFM